MALTVKFIESIKKVGRHADGRNGLYLQVKKSGLKSWIFRYSKDGRRREMGLGRIDELSLIVARSKALELTARLKDEIDFDPIQSRKQEKANAQLALKKQVITFRVCMEEFINLKKTEWTNKKHAQQWTNTLTTYVLPYIGDLPIQEISTAQVKELLLLLWTTKTETATRVRNRMEQIFNYSISSGYRSGDNPARWAGHLKNMLPAPNKVKTIKHHSALPYRDIYRFIKELRSHKCMSAYALEFLILTAARTGSVIKAQWSEIDFDNKLWTAPAEHMKAKKSHEVPLCERAMELLYFLHDKRMNDFIFVGGTKSGGLSNAAMDRLLQVRMGYTNVTVHGFRSSFRDWAGEETATANYVCEMALGHAISNDAEKAYRRGSLLEKRRVLMNQWLEYINTEPTQSKVLPFKKIAESSE